MAARNHTRWLWGGLIGLVLLVLLLATAFYIAVHTEFGARTVWRIATSVDARLSGEYHAGTLGSGLRLRNVVYEDSERRISIDRVSGDWQAGLSPIKLTVSNLAFGDVEVTQLPSPEEPLQLPQSLRLPLALTIEQATVQKLVIRTETATQTFTDIVAHGASDGLNHRLVLESANTPAGLAALQLYIKGERPFKLRGKASLDSQLEGENYQINADFSGSLEKLNVAAVVAGDKVTGQADIVATPFAALPFTNANISVNQLDLAMFHASAPKTSLDISAALQPVQDQAPGNLADLQVTGPVSIINRLPGPIDGDLLPIQSISGNARLDAQTQQLADVTIRLAGDAVLTGSAINHKPGEGSLSLQAQGLNLAAIHTALQPTRLDGPLEIAFDADRQQVRLDLASTDYSIKADAVIDAEKIVLNSAELASGKALLAMSGSLMRDEHSAYDIQGTLSNFNPGLFIKTMKIKAPQPEQDLPIEIYEANINGSFEATGRLKPELAAKAAFEIKDNSTYNDLPMRGRGTLNLAGKRVLDSDAKLSIAGNHLDVSGTFGRPKDQLFVNIDAPALDKLGFGLAGMLKLDGSFAGTMQAPRIKADFSAARLHFGEHRLASASGQVQMQGLPADGSDATLKLDLEAQGYRSDLARLDRLSANIDGSYGSHTIRLVTAGKLREQRIDLTLRAQGRLQQADDRLAWSGTLTQFDNSTIPQIHLADSVKLDVAPGLFRLGEADITIARAKLLLDHFSYESGAISSAGKANALDITHLLKLRQELTGEAPPMQTDLVLDGSWDFRLAQQAEGFVQIQRRSGDIISPAKTGDIRLGLSQLQVRGEFEGTQLNLHATADASRIGNLQADGRIQMVRPDDMLTITAESPVEGRIRFSIPQLQKIGVLAGPRISINGEIDVDLAVDGSVGNMALTGQINGRNLALTLYDQGVRLSNGTARMRLRDNVLEMQQVEFHGGEGTLRITGSIPINDQLATQPDLTANIIADKLELLADPSSQLTLSGQAAIFHTGEHYAVNGKFTVDRAQFDLPETAAPRLGDDVIVIRESDPSPQQTGDNMAQRKAMPWSPAINLEIDLGKNFYFQGRGADLRLAGQVTVVSQPGQQPSVRGTVRVAEGTFEAFGAELAIERGIINFQGPMDNPNVNILAMRRGQEVAAGVQVTGTANNPRVTLVSEPNVPEDQKLSWLVFGRGGTGDNQGATQAAAQGAAQALVNRMVEGTNIATNLGLDEVSVGTGASGEQLVRLGKTITDKLTLGYRQGITSAESAVELTYLLTQHWSVVARGGQVMGINILYSNRFDRIGKRKPEPPAAVE